MLIALIGPIGAGKHTIASYLQDRHSFRLASILSDHTEASSSTKDADLIFATATDLLEWATAHWTDPIVTLDLQCSERINVGFDKRPFFLPVIVDAPLTLRWSRTVETSKRSLVEFVAEDERAIFGDLKETRTRDFDWKVGNGSSSADLYDLIHKTPTRILNVFSSLVALHSHLDSLDLSSTHRLRPSWDSYFIALCTLASRRSNCMKRRVGAVLVRTNVVLSTGYNGTPRGLLNCNEGGCPRCNASAACGTQLDECLCLHAEENALLECGRERGGAEGTVLYCNTCPCLRCAVKIVQTGVREVVYQLEYSMDNRSRQIFESANVSIRKYESPV